ncbi:hypothetical protein BDN72DRAFT_839485 [Pluteus cervinus]|uniref:Uncharacterized protein n=1 Tax=Pluteus cervinus TaxID=181527 RepID=A0ACD3AXH5_9AGAR|nr:hypothetical protein BDN72DRAFT_839485 [Pluteus cervinus]
MQTPSAERTVSLEIEFNARSKSGIFHQENVPYPFNESDLACFAEDAGYTGPVIFNQLRERHRIQVTNHYSQFQVGQDGLINIDQPLLHYYHETFMPVSNSHRQMDRGSNSESEQHFSKVTLGRNSEFIDMDGMSIGLRRTIRVPDNGKEHLLPANMGGFKLYNVADYVDKLPSSVVKKGGLFIAMYQREALWIQFVSTRPFANHAVKVSVGDVNALTGLPRNQPAPQGKQDYAAVKTHGGQLWLDGISVAPGVVRQFVAMSLGDGCTVEGQVTGREDVGGLQFDVHDEYSTFVSFRSENNRAHLSLYLTPRKLGLTPGSIIYMEEPLYPSISSLSKAPRALGPTIRLRASPRLWLGGTLRVQTWTGKTITLTCEDSTTVDEVKDMVEAMEGIPPREQRLIYGGQQIHDGTLNDYGVQEGDTLYLLQSLMGGGPGPSGVDAFESQRTGATVGFAAGGSITQKIIRDNLPAVAYNFSGGRRLHISVINATHFPFITGLPAPPTPVSTQTYLNSKLPWFKMYEENLPGANNNTIGGALAAIKSVATIDRERAMASRDGSKLKQTCGYCVYEMATLRLVPCGHVVCSDCADGLSQDRCPSCPVDVTSRQEFAARMRLPGHEDGGGVDPLSMDERIVTLKRVAGTKEIISFRLREHDISGLCGEVEDEAEGL